MSILYSKTSNYYLLLEQLEYNYLFTPSPVIPYPYPFWVGEEGNTPSSFCSTIRKASSYKVENSHLKDTSLRGGLSEFVCRNTFCTSGPTLKTIYRGLQKYKLLESSLNWESKNFNSRDIGATRETLLRQKSKILCDPSESA